MALLPCQWPPSLDPWSPVGLSWIAYTKCRHHSLPTHRSWECVKPELVPPSIERSSYSERETAHKVVPWFTFLLTNNFRHDSCTFTKHHTYLYTNIRVLYTTSWFAPQGSGHGSRSKQIPSPDHPQSHGPRHTSPRWSDQELVSFYKDPMVKSERTLRQRCRKSHHPNNQGKPTGSSLQQNVHLRIILIMQVLVSMVQQKARLCLDKASDSCQLLLLRMRTVCFFNWNGPSKTSDA